MSRPDEVIPAFLEGAAAATKLQKWVYTYALRENLFTPGDRVLVAVSGGPDSVALLHLLFRLRRKMALELGVAHFDHGLRRESMEDAAFVAELAASLSLPFYAGQGSVSDLARAEKLSIQMAARKLRLSFLKETRRRHSYDRLALGHTAEDQVELFWLRLLRGAGLEGLRGMWPATSQGLVRPLLAVTKAVLLDWLHQDSLPYRLDASNQSLAYLRNRVRLDLLPHLAKSYNPRLAQTIWRTQALLRADERLLARETEKVWSRVGKQVAEGLISLDLPSFLALDPDWQGRLLRQAAATLGSGLTITASQVAALLALARGKRSGGLVSLGPGGTVAHAGYRLHFFQPLISPPKDALSQLQISPGSMDGPGGWRWSLASRDCVPGPPWPPPEVAWVNPNRLPFPLEGRYFQPGDRFWPQGAPGPKKLQDFLVNCRVPRWLRHHLPLVASGGEIIWVPGLRVAEPVKVLPDSRAVLEIKITPVTATASRIWEMVAKVRDGEL